MKRLCLLLLCSLFLLLPACLGETAPPGPLPESQGSPLPPAPQNTQAPLDELLEPFPLSTHDRDLLAAVGRGQSILFRYNAPEEARQVVLRLDSLGQDGLWSSRDLGSLYLGAEDAHGGTVALHPAADGGFDCTLLGGNGAATLGIEPPKPDERTKFSGQVICTEKQAIQLDEPIPLVLTVYSESGSFTLPPLEAYGQTELLKGLPQARAISLVFKGE